MGKIAVLKFGGSSLSNSQKIENAVIRSEKFLKSYSKILIVLSAPSNITDDLIKISSYFNPDNTTLEKILTIGEQISIYLFEMALKKRKIKAISLNHYQLKIKIDENKEIKSLDLKLIKKNFNYFDIIILPGFIGIDKDQNPLTLGRGGSDYTAVYLANKLKADCYLLSDIKGVYSSNPSKIENAKKLDEITYTEILEISKFDSQIRQNKAMEYAAKKNLQIFLGSTFEKSKMTLITSKKNKNSKIRYIFINSTQNTTDITLIAENIYKRKDIKEKIEKLNPLSYFVNKNSITMHFPKLNTNEIKKIYFKFILK